MPTLQYDGSYPITIEATVVVDQNEDKGIVIGDSSETGIRLAFPVTRNSKWPHKGGFVNVRSDEHYPLLTLQPLQPQKIMRVAAILDGKSSYLFLDGALQDSRVDLPGEFVPAHKPLMIGNCPSVLNWFKGQIDEVRISKGVRYRNDYTPRRRLEPDAQTIALYHFDEGKGNVLNDSSGNNHHGKIVKAKWTRLGTPANREKAP